MSKKFPIILHKITSKQQYNDSFFRFADKMGWNPCYSDFELYLDKQNTHAFVGYYDKKPVLSFLYYEYKLSNLVAIGLYYASPELRNQNIIYPLLLQKHLEISLPYNNIMLVGVKEMALKYFKVFNTKIFGKVYNRKLVYDPLKKVLFNKNSIKESFEVDFDEFKKFDFECCGYHREQILEKFCEKVKNFHCLVYQEKGEIQGYGCIFHNENVFRIGPLFANNKYIAKELLDALKGRIGGNEQKNIFVNVHETEDSDQNRFWDLEGFSFDKNGFGYIQSTIKLKRDWSKTFAVYSCEIGY